MVESCNSEKTKGQGKDPHPWPDAVCKIDITLF
jgi:hypothetical protein